MKHTDALCALEALSDRAKNIPQAALVEAPALLQHPRQRNAVLEVHFDVGVTVNPEEASSAEDVGGARGRREVPQDLGCLDLLLEAECVALLRGGTDGGEGTLGLAVPDRARKVFFELVYPLEMPAARFLIQAQPSD